jgi:hypothetical protein
MTWQSNPRKVLAFVAIWIFLALWWTLLAVDQLYTGHKAKGTISALAAAGTAFAAIAWSVRFRQLRKERSQIPKSGNQ